MRPRRMFASSVADGTLPMFYGMGVRFYSSLGRVFPGSGGISRAIVSIYVLPFLRIVLFPRVVSGCGFFVLSL